MVASGREPEARRARHLAFKCEPKAAASRIPAMSVDWFRRLAEIPGIEYEGMSALDRGRLKGHDATPTVHAHDKRDNVPGPAEVLWWARGSASPVHERAFSDKGAMTTPELLRNVAEALELPGEPNDYYWAVQSTVAALWSRRRAEPDVLDEIERLCWLGIRLIQTRPDAITDKYRPEGGYYGVPGFQMLITLYEREGALREALQVAELAERFDQLAEKATELRERLSVLEAEDA
jgi:hypothetical protein